MQIARIQVEELYGRYSFAIGEEPDSTAAPLILYGENGVGKTTVMKLLYAVLCPEPGSGHRSFIAGIAFRRFALDFDEGSSVEVVREGSDAGDFSYSIQVQGAPLLKVPVTTEMAEGSWKVGLGKNPRLQEIESLLAELGVALVYIPTTRVPRIHGVDHGRGGSFLGYAGELGRKGASRFPVRSRARDMSLEQLLSESLADVAQQSIRMFEDVSEPRISALRGRSAGQGPGPFPAAVRELASVRVEETIGGQAVAQELVSELEALRRSADRLSRFSLADCDEIDDLISSVRTADHIALKYLSVALNPYMAVLKSNYETLDVYHARIAPVVDLLNRLLIHKSVSYSVGAGMRLATDAGQRLGVSRLSSGEKHLIAIVAGVSAVVAAANGPCIVLIDEPEISMNVKWQQALLPGIMDCVQPHTSQFIVATHSLDVISTLSNSWLITRI